MCQAPCADACTISGIKSGGASIYRSSHWKADHRLTLTGLAAGLVGSVIDSVLGATIQFTGVNRKTGKLTSKYSSGIVPISGIPLLSNNAVRCPPLSTVGCRPTLYLRCCTCIAAASPFDENPESSGFCARVPGESNIGEHLRAADQPGGAANVCLIESSQYMYCTAPPSDGATSECDARKSFEVRRHHGTNKNLLPDRVSRETTPEERHVVTLGKAGAWSGQRRTYPKNNRLVRSWLSRERSLAGLKQQLEAARAVGRA